MKHFIIPPGHRRVGVFPVLVAVALLSVSCTGALRTDRIVVRMPTMPGAWRETGAAFRFSLVFVDDGGNPVCIAAAPGEAVALEFVRGSAHALLCYPFVSGLTVPGMLRPAGAVYPGGLDGDKLLLSWEGGPAATCAGLLASSGFPIGGVDWGRFTREALARSGDPWRIDLEQCARAFLRETFSASLLSPDALCPVAVPLLPVAGTGAAGGATGISGAEAWASASPFAPMPVDDGAGSLVTLSPAGIGCFFSARRSVSFSLTEDGSLDAIVWRNAVSERAACPKGAGTP